MADVFSNAPEEDDDDQTPGIRVAGALTGEGEETPEEESPEVTQPQGKVDDSGQSYLTPAGADDGETGPPQASEGDTPVSDDTKAYMTPIAAPTLVAPKDYADHSADMAAMTEQKQAESRQNIKPSFGRRLLAGIAGGAVSFGGGDGAATGEKVLNRPAQRAQQQWALQEAPLQAKLNADAAADAATRNANANTEQSNRLAETNYRNQSLSQQNAARAADYQAQAEQRKNAITAFTPDDPANPYAGGTGTTADGRTVKGVPPPDKWIANWEKNPDNVASAKAQAGVKTLKALEASGVKLTPEQRAIVASGGKITPSTHTNISILENPDGSARTPAGQAGQAGPGEVIAKSIQDKDTFASQWKRVGRDEATDITPEGSYQNVDDPGKVMSPQEFNNRIEKFRTDLNANSVMRRSGTMVNEKGEMVSNRFSRNPTTAPPPQAPPQSPTPPPAPSGMKVSLSRARTLPINKGKTDDQIRADIAAHGHQVAP